MTSKIVEAQIIDGDGDCDLREVVFDSSGHVRVPAGIRAVVRVLVASDDCVITRSERAADVFKHNGYRLVHAPRDYQLIHAPRERREAQWKRERRGRGR